MRRLPFHPLLLLLGAAMLAGCGRLPGTGVVADPAFLERDGNGDGQLTQVEARLAGVAFDALDLDGSQTLDILEWQAAATTPGAVWQVQRNRDEQRDMMEPRRTGNT